MKKYLLTICCSLFLLGNSAFAQWTNLAGPYGGNIKSIVYDVTSSRAYALSSNTSKVYRSTNDGASWQQINAINYAYSIMVDGTSVFASDYSSLYKSTDGGVNWTTVSQSGFQYGLNLKKVETNVYVVGGYGIWISLDAGVNWSKVSDHSDYIYNLGVSPTGDIYYSYYSSADGDYVVKKHTRPIDGVSWSTSTVEKVITSGLSYYTSFGFQGSNIFVSGSQEIFKSATGDAGSWVSSNNGILETSLNGGVFCQNPAGDLFYFEPNYRKAYVTTSSSGGNLWTGISWPSANFSNYNVLTAIAPTNAKMFVGTELDAIFFSSDNGTTWTNRSTNISEAEGTDIEIASDNTLYYKTGYYSSGLWKSTSGGTSWSFLPAPSYRSLFVSSNNTLFAFGNYNNRSLDQGLTWNSIPGAYSIIEPSPGNIYGVGYGTSNIYYTADEGTNWSNVVISGLPAWAGAMYGAAYDANTLFITLRNYNDGSTSDDDRGEVYKVTLSSATTGSAVLVFSTGFENNEYEGKFFVANNKVYYTTTQNIHYSADAGDTWNSFGFENRAVVPIQGGLCLSTYGTLLITQDDGKSFNSTTLPNGNAYILDIAQDSNGDYIASAANSSALKFTNELIVDPALLPPYIDFDWQPLAGPFGGGNNREIKKNPVDNSYLLFSDNKLFRSTDPSNAPWVNISKNNSQSSYFYDFAINSVNGDLYSLEWSTLYKSTNQGQNWSQIPNSENLYGRMYINSFSDGRLLLTRNYNSDYLFHISADGGQNFGPALHSFSNNNTYVSEVVITSTDVVYVRYYNYDTQSQVIIRSVDFGGTWETLTLPISNAERLTNDEAGNIYIAADKENIFVSVDNGDNWTNIAGDAPSVAQTMSNGRIWISPIGELYFAGYHTTGPGFFRSANQGTSWEFMGDLSDLLNDRNFGIYDFNDLSWNGSTMYLAAIGNVFKSTDGGATLTEINQGIDNLGFPELELVNESKLMAFGSGYGTYQSTDLNNWSRVPSLSLSKTLKLSDGSIIGYGGYQTIRKSLDGGTTWNNLSSNLPGAIQKLATFNETNFYALINNGIYTTTDFENWTQVPINGLPSNPNINDFVPFSGGRIYLVHYNNQSNLNELYRVQFSSATRVNIGQSPGNIQLFKGDILVYDVRGGLFKSSDGTTWTQKGAPGNGDKMIVTEKDYFFIPVSNLGLWLSRDLGTTWQNVGASSNQYWDRFTDVVINEYDGYAYASFTSGPVRKSANIVVPDDETAPVIESLYPAPGATNVNANPELRITFDEPVSPETGFNIIIVDVTNLDIPAAIIDAQDGLIERDGKTLIYKPATPLGYNKSYFVLIDEKRTNDAPPPAELGAFKDIFGNPFVGLQNPASWTFSTQPSPTLNALSPADNATAVSVNPQISLTFSETMNLGTNKNLYLRRSSDNALVEVLGNCIEQDQFAAVSNQPLFANKATNLLFDASKGNQALVGAAKVYAHAYVIASKEADPVPYYFAVGNWGEDDGIGEMTRVSGETDKWELALAPSIREYFQVPLNYRIDSLGVVFRNANGTVRANPPATVQGAYVWQNQFGDYDVFFDLTNSSTLTFELCTPLQFSTSYYIQADATAFASADGVPLGYITSTTAWNFTTIAEPVITSLSPTNGATGVVLSPVLSLNFNTTVQPVTGKTINLYEVGTDILISTINVEDLNASGNGFNFSFPALLNYGTQYYVTAEPGAFQINGVALNPLQSQADWQFTTIDQPFVISTSPTHNQGNVDFVESLTLTFSEPVYAMDGTVLTIFKKSDGSVIDQISLDGMETDNSDVLTIPLSFGLFDFATEYELIFDAEAFRTIDMVPFSILSNSNEWLFTTRNAPSVVSLSPANNASNVAQKPTVTIEFSDPVSVVNDASIGFNPAPAPSSPFAFSEVGVVSGTNPNRVSFTLSSIDLEFSTEYFLKVTADAFSYKGRVFSVLTGDSEWNITVTDAPDGVAPVFDSFTPPTFIKNSSNNAVSVGVTDAASGIANVKLFHRKMRSEGAFTEQPMTLDVANSYKTSITTGMLDELGLEYYFTATDASPTPNTKRLPVSESEYFSSGVRMESGDNPSLPSAVVGVGGQPSNYRIFSVPFVLESASIPVVLNELGAPNKELYRLLTYNKTKQNGWAEYDTDFNTIDRGKGYWLNSKTSLSIALEGASTTGFSKAVPYRFQLNAGWNQIGNPYPFAIDWDDVKNGNTNVSGIVKFANGYLPETNVLGPYEGGFVFVDGTANVNLDAPISVGNSGGRVNKKQEDFSKGWLLPIVVSQGAYTNNFTAIGMHPEAAKSGDRFDKITPPRFIEYLEANFEHPEHTGRNFSTDVVPLTSEYTWDFIVESNLSGPISLDWSGFSKDFAEQLILFDVNRHLPIDMKTASSYTFIAGESSRFKIYYGKNFEREFDAGRVTLGQVYPNPTNGELTIAFSLPAEGGQRQLVEVEMIDAVGRSLGTVMKQTLGAGFHELSWHGEDVLSSTGLFTYKLKVSNEKGNEVLQGKIMVRK